MAKKKLTYRKGGEKVLGDGRTRKTYSVSNDDNKPLTKNQIKNQYKQIQKLQQEYIEQGKNFKYAIVAGLINNQVFNIKSYNADKLSTEINNYLDGMVKDTSKFQQISYLSIIIEQ
jgi:hypothetical protein